LKKMELNLNVKQWWTALSSSLLAGADSLGAYLDASGLTLAHLQQSFSGLMVRNVMHLPAAAGKLEELAPALKELAAAWRLESCPVGLVVSRELGFLRRATLPAAVAENLDQVMTYELDRFLPLPAEKLFFDYQVLETTETEIHLMLQALPREPLEKCLNLFAEASLRVISLELAPTSLGNAFAILRGKLPPAWLLLHLAPGAFELTLFQGATLKGLTHGKNLAPKELARAVTAGVDGIIQAGFEPGALCLYGAGSEFDVGALSPYGLEVIYPGHFTLQGLPPETEQSGALPAVGGALRCLGKAPLKVNLLPASERSAVKLGGFTFARTSMALLLGLCLIWAGSALIHKRVLLYQVNSKLEELIPQAKAVEKQLDESRALAKQIESLGKIGQSPDKLKILKDLTQIIPVNTWLFNLKLSKQTLDIGGMSKSASELIPLLDKSGWLKKTEFASPIVTDASKFEHFKIKAELKNPQSGS
jgi:Tfp pilus assembly protein PilN